MTTAQLTARPRAGAGVPVDAAPQAVLALDGDAPLAVLCDRTHAPLLIEAIAVTGTPMLDRVWDLMTLAMHRNVHYRAGAPQTIPVAGVERRALAHALTRFWERCPAARRRIEQFAALHYAESAVAHG